MQNFTRTCRKKWTTILKRSVLALSVASISLSLSAHADALVAVEAPAAASLESSLQSGVPNAQLTNDSLAVETTLNINSASVVELANTLPGIGMLKAQRIVEWRRSNGLFEYKDQLLEIPGIGVKTLERIQPYFHLGETPSAMLDDPLKTSVNDTAPVLANIVRGAISDAERARTLAQGG